MTLKDCVRCGISFEDINEEYPDWCPLCISLLRINPKDFIMNLTPFSCQYCKRNLTRILDEKEGYRKIICLNCGKQWEVKEVST